MAHLAHAMGRCAPCALSYAHGAHGGLGAPTALTVLRRVVVTPSGPMPGRFVCWHAMARVLLHFAYNFELIYRIM